MSCNPVSTVFADQYRRALAEYLGDGGEGALNEAYELGRGALKEGISLLDLASLHHDILQLLMSDARTGEFEARAAAAGRFFNEVLSPFELFLLSNKDTAMAMRRLNQVLEDEAKRIAHALHDESAQLLAATYLELAEISRVASGEVKTRVAKVVEHLDQVREQIRRLSHELRPPILDQLGLIPALRFLGGGAKKRASLDVEVDGPAGARFSEQVETALYRTAQEAINNTVKHARATRVQVNVWTEEQIVYCSIKDNGIGMKIQDPDQIENAGLGLMGIRERVAALNGRLSINSIPGNGTELVAAIPVDS